MSTESDSQKHHEPEEFLEHLWEPVAEFVRERGVYVIVGLALVAAAAMGWKAYRLHVVAQRNTAWNKLASVPVSVLRQVPASRQPADLRGEVVDTLRDVAEAHAGSSAAPWALLELAALQANAGNWPAALQTYDRLLTTYPDSTAGAAARPARAEALEATGHYEEAAGAFTALARERAPLYHFSAGRCLELAGRADAAIQAYEAFVEAGPDDEMASQMALARLSELRRGNLLSEPPELAVSKPQDRPILEEAPAPEVEPPEGEEGPEAGAAGGAVMDPDVDEEDLEQTR